MADNYDEAFSIDLEQQHGRQDLLQKNCLTVNKSGQFCDIVYLEDKHNQRVYAVKNYKIRDDSTGDLWKEVMRRVENEISVLRLLKHPFIIKFYDYYKSKTSYNLVTECYFDDLALRQSHFQGGVLDEATAGRYFLQLALAFDYLHHKGFLFGYITNQDIVLDPFDNIKLVNFSKVQSINNVSTEMLKRLDINYEYLAPEYFDTNQQITPCADLWALGVLLFQWVHGRMPFKQDHLFQNMQNIVEQPAHLSHSTLSQGLSQLLSGLLHKDPLSRWNLEQVFTSQWVLDLCNRLELTDLINPAFLANKRIVEALLFKKFPQQQKSIRLGYQYKEPSLVTFKGLLDHVEYFNEERFQEYQGMASHNLHKTMHEQSQMQMKESKMNNSQLQMPRRTIFQDDLPFNTIPSQSVSHNNTFSQVNDQQSQIIHSVAQEQAPYLNSLQQSYVQDQSYSNNQPIIHQHQPYTQQQPIPADHSVVPSHHDKSHVVYTLPQYQNKPMQQNTNLQGVINKFSPEQPLQRSRIFTTSQNKPRDQQEVHEMQQLQQRLGFNGQ